jgi:tRNA A37 N6-isopentenylltransferase MiaA
MADQALLIAVVGPTATGKSQLALELAEKLDGEIVGADAMALYRGMDIGTAKTPLAKRRGIAHHQIDVLDVTQEASVAAYQRQARADIVQVWRCGKAAVVVGGSGLYIRALLAQIDFPLPEGMVKLREERILGDARLRLEQHEARDNTGKSADEVAAAKAALEDTLATMQPEARREAETLTRVHLLLMTVARKENIQANPHEADMQLYNMAMRSGQDFKQLREAYVRSGLMEELLERIQADKAMDFIYDKAEVITITAPTAAEPSASTGA